MPKYTNTPLGKEITLWKPPEIPFAVSCIGPKNTFARQLRGYYCVVGNEQLLWPVLRWQVVDAAEEDESVNSHIDVLGWLYIIFGALGMVVGMGIFLFFGGLAILPDDATGTTVLLIIGWFIGGLLVVTSIPEIVGGIGLLKRKNWARILIIILGCLNLIDIPLGTILGIYTLWVLLKEESTKYFPSTA